MRGVFFGYFVLKLQAWSKIVYLVRGFAHQTEMRILNVAEKNDAAKNIAGLLSSGAATCRQGLSPRNKIYEFDFHVFGQNNRMIMTSVSGHIADLDFADCYRSWKNCDPSKLFEAPLKISTKSDLLQIHKTLEREIKSCSKLIIWTDCDREGENIGFEIINICKGAKRNIEVYRAKFSEITAESVKRALRNLDVPNKNVSDAVDVRRELDLRIGAAFTRFQTLYLKKAFPNALGESLISYGSCQFPTLGFVVERFKAISEFKPEPFWSLQVQHTLNELTVKFNWERNRIFNKLACEALYDKCAEDGNARVEKVESKRTTKWRPRPLDTVALQKLVSKKLHINAKETLGIAEKLYTRGLISYPRTETNFFSKDIDLARMVGYQTEDAQWGEFAQRVLRDGPNPFQGTKSDQAHPPIHPTKYSAELSGNEKKIYEFIVRHFLACLSKHAEGLATTVRIDVAGEKFSAKGLMVTAKNYLEVYPYEKWSDQEIHLYREGDVFKADILMEESETSPPELLTEADLIALMEKHGIGTDATHAEHIETIKARLYVGLQDGKYFVPRTLGMGLVEGYNSMGYGMAKPELRAELEADLKRISDAQLMPDEALSKHIDKYKNIYNEVQRQVHLLSEAIRSYIQVEPTPVEPGTLSESDLTTVGRCPTCGSDLLLRPRKNGQKFISCSAYPQCRVVLWLPSFVLNVTPTTDPCPVCGPGTFLLRFKFQKGSCSLPSDYVGCIGGCDWYLLEILNSSNSGSKMGVASGRSAATVERVNDVNDSGFASLNENSISEEGPPKCDCGLGAVLETVKKAGPNEGRLFYKCGGRGPLSSKCNFFQWQDQARRTRTTNPIQVEEDDIRCYCSLPCKRVTTTKAGPNKGREFFSCAKSFGDPDKCNFFKWVDDSVSGRTTASNSKRKKR